MTVRELLEFRHTAMLEWIEPAPACGPEGNELAACLIVRATVHDCVNMQRAVAKANGMPTMGEDVRHLEEFMAVHFAVYLRGT